jgi:hypothetical protein
LLIARSRAEGNTTYRSSPEKAAPPQAPTKESEERPKTEAALKEPDGRGSAT